MSYLHLILEGIGWYAILAVIFILGWVWVMKGRRNDGGN
jgi:hypothetical protein